GRGTKAALVEAPIKRFAYHPAGKGNNASVVLSMPRGVFQRQASALRKSHEIYPFVCDFHRYSLLYGLAALRQARLQRRLVLCDRCHRAIRVPTVIRSLWSQQEGVAANSKVLLQ